MKKAFKVKWHEDGYEEECSDFFKYTHAFNMATQGEYTLCGLAFEEFKITQNVKKITCPHCIRAIEFHKTFKKGIDY